MRGATPLVQEVIKAATAYQKNCAKVSESGKQLADATFRLGQFVQGDLGKQFTFVINSVQKEMEC